MKELIYQCTNCGHKTVREQRDGMSCVICHGYVKAIGDTETAYHSGYTLPKEELRFAAIEGFIKIYHEYEESHRNAWDKAEVRRLIDKYIADLYREETKPVAIVQIDGGFGKSDLDTIKGNLQAMTDVLKRRQEHKW